MRLYMSSFTIISGRGTLSGSLRIIARNLLSSRKCAIAHVFNGSKLTKSSFFAKTQTIKPSRPSEYEEFAMEPSEQTLEPDRARAAFNMVALHLAGYTFSQIELFHPSNMTAERLHELLDRKAANLLGEWAAKQDLKIEPTSKAELAQKDRRD